MLCTACLFEPVVCVRSHVETTQSNALPAPSGPYLYIYATWRELVLNYRRCSSHYNSSSKLATKMEKKLAHIEDIASKEFDFVIIGELFVPCFSYASYSQLS